MRAAPAVKGSGVASPRGRRLLAAALLGVLLGGCAAGKTSPHAQGVTSADASTPAYTNGAAASTPGDPPSVQAPPERVFTGQAVGVITLRDLTMTSGAQGYALGAIQQSTVIAETADGGASWSAVGLSLPELLPGDRTTVVGFGQSGGLPGRKVLSWRSPVPPRCGLAPTVSLRGIASLSPRRYLPPPLSLRDREAPPASRRHSERVTR